MRLILASASPRRRELLSALVKEFEVQPSGLEEAAGGDPRDQARQLALAKARELGRQHPGAVVVGADTIVHDGRREYGKPGTADEARRILRRLRGKTHRVLTGVAVVTGDSEVVEHSEATVTLTNLPDPVIERYIASGRPFDKAGGYAIQDSDVPTVSALEGCQCCVIGLPLWRLRGMLESAGVVTSQPDRTFGRCAMCPERR